MIYAILLVATRYEGLFIVFGTCLLLFLKKQWTKAFILGIIAMLPVLIFGLISVMKGSYFLPNSVLVKSEAAQFTPGGLVRSFNTILVEKFMFARAGITLLATQRLLLLLPLTYIVFRKSLRTRPSWAAGLMILTVATFLQLALADTGKFYRYEASLVMMSVLIISLIVSVFYKSILSGTGLLTKTFSILIFSFLAFPLLLRSMAAFTKAPRAMVNIYEQQYQMALFLQKYFPRATIAANDIGAISYFRDGRILDLWGLGTFEVARSRKGYYWNGNFLDSMASKKGAGIAIIYDSWIADAIPPNWKKVANWKISHNVVAGDDNVSFYIVDPSTETELIKGLKEFEMQLPPTVKVAYY